MKNWFTTLNGAITLSAIAWLSELWRAWLDMMFVYPQTTSASKAVSEAEIDSAATLIVSLIYTALFAGWAYSMHVAAQGSRPALITTFALNLLIWLAIPVGWFVAYCPGGCPALTMNVANWLNLIFGLLAGIALGLQLVQKKPAHQAA